MSTAQVVLMGKTTKKNHEITKELLSNVNATEVPRKFIDEINVIFDNGDSVEFETSRIKDNFTMDSIQEFLDEVDVNGRIVLIEIRIDMDKIYETIKTDSNTILEKCFSN